jgi:uncharacterized membrane protein
MIDHRHLPFNQPKMIQQPIKFLALFLTGLIAGTFFYGTFTVLPAFYSVSPEIHLGFRISLMSYNKVLVMTLVLLTILAIAWHTWQVRKMKVVRLWCLSALLLTILSLVITRFGSVPINLQIKAWDPVSPPANWLTILERWDFYNAIRTAASLASFGCLLAAGLWKVKPPKLA